MTPNCDEGSYSHQTKVAGQLSYSFPIWLLAWVFVGTITPAPTTSLCVAKVIPSRSSTFHHAMLGNVDGIRKLFDQDLASPFDVAELGPCDLQVRRAWLPCFVLKL